MLLSLIPQLVFAIPPDQANPGEHAAVVISELNLPDHVYDRVVANHYGAVLDTKPVRLNKNSFKKIWLENEQRYLNADSKALVGQFVNLPLLAGEVIRLNVEKVEMLLEGIDVVTYSGIVDGYPDSRFVFSIEDDVIYGDVKFDQYVYKLHTTEDNNPRQIMSKINPRLMPRDTEDDVSDLDKMVSEIPPEIKSSNGGGNVRVLFLYASNVYNPNVKISTLISNFNWIKNNSQVSSSRFISSAGTKMINNTFTSASMCKNNIVNYYMPNNTNGFETLNVDMSSNYADVAFMILNGPSGHSFCSTDFPLLSGHIGGQVSDIFNSASPYGVVADNYLSGAADYTGVHELGHIFGGHHPDTVTTINQGVINIYKQWQTIMGFYKKNTVCEFIGPTANNCDRLPFFSNPNITYNGDPLGSSNANMGTYLNSSMYSASNWESEPVPPPAAPTSLSVTSGQCYGFNEINWNSSNNATSYQLYRSTHPYFYSPTLVYSGGLTSSFVHVSSSGWYLKVKACNAAGCSGYSNQVFAAYTNYCQ